MLTLIALSAVLLQEPSAPPPPPEARARVVVMESGGTSGLDKDGDGEVSREEFAAPLNDHFGRMDTNDDGRLSAEELSGGRGPAGDGEVMVFRGGPEGGAEPRHFEIRRDRAGDERRVVFIGGEPGAQGEREITIRSVGGEGGPRIIHAPGHRPGGESRVELRRHGPGDGNIEVRMLGGDGLRGGHGEMDRDGDGKVSEGEFIAPLREAFGRMDADRSGFIEEGEHGGEDGDVRVFTHRIETRQGED